MSHCVLTAFTEGNDCCALASEFRNVVHLSKIVFEVLPLGQTIQNTFKPMGPDVCGLLKRDTVMEVGQSEHDAKPRHKCLDAP